MSTDPREFEHPIDGTGGTVPPQAIEAVARALRRANIEKRAVVVWPLDTYKESATAALTAALTAAYPIMAAEVLRDTAKDFAEGEWVDALMEAENDVETVVAVDEWLNHRAATIESEAPNV